MIYHFVNLVSWRFFIKESVDLDRSLVYCDSIVVKLLAKIIANKRVKQVSGPLHFEENFLSLKNICYLESVSSGNSNSLGLPFWKSIEDVEYNERILDFVAQYDSVILGVSAPKQDRLAILLSKIYPEKDFYCYGAATKVTVGHMFVLQKARILWLYFLLKSPIRTTNKIWKTLKEVVLIIFNKETRIDFMNLINIMR